MHVNIPLPLAYESTFLMYMEFADQLSSLLWWVSETPHNSWTL